MIEREPSAMELAADPADLEIIKELFGSRGQTLINILLAFDAYFAWYFPLVESVPLDAEYAPMTAMSERRSRRERAAKVAVSERQRCRERSAKRL